MIYEKFYLNAWAWTYILTIMSEILLKLYPVKRPVWLQHRESNPGHLRDRQVYYHCTISDGSKTWIWTRNLGTWAPYFNLLNYLARNLLNKKLFMTGFEPATNGLKVRCSTIELHKLSDTDRTWTYNSLINSQMLYRLSYCVINFRSESIMAICLDLV